MPILKNVKTVGVDPKPWTSPDGKVTIWTVHLQADGETIKHSTMSQAVATEGFMGDVEVYVNPKGKEYVRQAPKEEQSGNPSSSFAGKPNDPFTMYLSYAKDIVVAQITAGEFKGAGTDTLTDTVLVAAYELYNGRPDAEKPGNDKVFPVGDEPITIPEGF